MERRDSLSLIFTALADPTRRAILSRLAQGPATVGEVAQPFDISAPAVSQHIKVLERANLVSRTTRAQWRTLSLRIDSLAEISTWVDTQRREWESRLDALEDHLEEMKSRPEQKEQHNESDQQHIREA